MSSIVSQTWEAIEASNAIINSEKRAQKKGEARLAEENSSVACGSLGRLQQIKKDVISAADPESEISTTTNAPSGTSSKPQLPPSGFDWNAFQGIGGDQEGLIAIMGKVLAQQAKTNSQFWSSLWKQASQSMLIQAKMAPIIGQAINAAYQNQAQATMCQANQAKEDGLASILAFGGAVVMAGVTEYNDPNSSLNDSGDEIEAEDDPDEVNANEESEKNVSTKTDDAINDSIEEEDKQLNKTEEGFKDRAKKWWGKGKPGFTKGQKLLSSLLMKAQQSAALTQMLSQGITGLCVDSKYQAQKSTYEGQEGECQALSKEAEQYAQYYGQDFSRCEDLRQGSSQNIDYAMNVLKGAADSITQSVTSMFRG